MYLTKYSRINYNYFLGRIIGKRIFKDDAKILKTAHLEKAQEFFNKYGPLAIIVLKNLVMLSLMYLTKYSRIDYNYIVVLRYRLDFITDYNFSQML